MKLELPESVTSYEIFTLLIMRKNYFKPNRYNGTTGPSGMTFGALPR